MMTGRDEAAEAKLERDAVAQEAALDREQWGIEAHVDREAWASQAALDRWRTTWIAMIAAAGVAIVAAVGITLWVTSDDGGPPDLWEVGPEFLVASQEPDGSWTQPVNEDRIPIVEIPVGLPLAVAVCSDVEQPFIQISRRWEAFDGTTSVFSFREEAGPLQSVAKAGECVTSAAILTLPLEVIEEALDRPGLVWRLRSEAIPTDPAGAAHAGTSEPFVFADLTGDEEIVDRSGDMAGLLSDLEASRTSDDK